MLMRHGLHDRLPQQAADAAVPEPEAPRREKIQWQGEAASPSRRRERADRPEERRGDRGDRKRLRASSTDAAAAADRDPHRSRVQQPAV